MKHNDYGNVYWRYSNYNNDRIQRHYSSSKEKQKKNYRYYPDF